MNRRFDDSMVWRVIRTYWPILVALFSIAVAWGGIKTKLDTTEKTTSVLERRMAKLEDIAFKVIEIQTDLRHLKEGQDYLVKRLNGKN